MKRKPILVVGDLSRAALLASIPVAYAFDALTLGHALRRRLPGRRLHRLLRRRVPVVPAFARRPQPAGRGQLEARDQPLGLAARRARARLEWSSPRLGAPVAILLDAISFFVSALFLFSIRKTETLPDARRARGTPEHARGRTRRARVRAPQPLPACDLDLHRLVELLLEHGRRDPRRLRGARAGACRPPRSGWPSRSGTSGRWSPPSRRTRSPAGSVSARRSSGRP